MNILHIYKQYPPVIGGIENHLKVLAEAQAAQGHRVTVLVTGRSRTTADTMEGGVRVIRAARITEVASTPLSLALFGQLRSLKPDITHLQFPYPPGEVAYQLLGSGKLVISYQSDIVRQKLIGFLYRPLLERVLRRADRILISSSNYADSSKVLQHHREKCRVVPLGIQVETFLKEHPEEAEGVRNRYGTPLLLFVGRLCYYKGIPYLLKAMEGLDARLVIAGDGPKSDEWKGVARDLKLQDRVFFLGEVTERQKRALYQACDIFLLPSSERSEAYGLVQLEAMASGRPVISTDLATGTSFVNQHEETGLVVPPRRPGALREAISRLGEDPELRTRLGHQARKRAFEEFTVEKMVSRIDGIYRELLDSRAV